MRKLFIIIFTFSLTIVAQNLAAKTTLLFKPYIAGGFSNIVYTLEHPNPNTSYAFPVPRGYGRIYSAGADVICRWRRLELSGGLQYLSDGVRTAWYTGNYWQDGRDVFAHITAPVLVNGVFNLGKRFKLLAGGGIVSSYNLQYKSVMYVKTNTGQQIEASYRIAGRQFGQAFRRITFDLGVNVQLEAKLSEKSAVYVGCRYYRMFSDLYKDVAFKMTTADVAFMAGYGFKLK